MQTQCCICEEFGLILSIVELDRHTERVREVVGPVAKETR